MSCPKCGGDLFDLLKQTSDNIVSDIFEDLRDRGGFEEVLESCHPATIAMMADELTEIVMKRIIEMNIKRKREGI